MTKVHILLEDIKFLKTFFVMLCFCFEGRLSKEEIDRMVNDAEKYKDEDNKQRERIQAKNGLESYAFQLKSTVEDEKVKDKITDTDKEAITNKVKETLDWLEGNQVIILPQVYFCACR